MAWYDNGEKGIVGQVANLALKRVESFPAGGSIKAGSLVKLDSTNSKVVQLNKSADKGAILGVALKVNREPYADGYTYHAGDTVSVLTAGDVFMTVSGSAKYGQVFTGADGTDTLTLTAVNAGTASTIDKLMAVENASGLVAVRVKD